MNWTFEMGRIKHIHFVGIGGVGMAGIAEVLLSEGYIVSGSDNTENTLTKRLQSMGAILYKGHEAIHVNHADVVVRSSAISLNNVEITAAKVLRIPVVARAEMLGELMRFRCGIAIAGTHGKTTTTSLVTSVLAEAGLDPTFVIGGKLNSANSNARLGNGKYLVAEADESDASFLYLKPMMAVITNIDKDHMETYHYDFNELCKTFVNFLQQLPFYGLAVLCLDDPTIRTLLADVSRPYLTYGFTDDVNFKGINIQFTGTKTHFTVIRPNNRSAIDIILNLPGRHNILNALAAIAIATELNIPDEFIKSALEKFDGIGRRFQMYGDFLLQKGGSIKLIDDYGHHPRELEVTIDAVRQSFPKKRLVMVFQPHRYSRTRDLFNEFVAILTLVDVLILLEVYAAGEEVIADINSAALIKAIQKNNKEKQLIHISKHSQLASALQTILRDQDILLMQGAGNIGALSSKLALTNLQESVIEST